MAAATRRPGGAPPGPPPDDGRWPVGERRDGWLKVSDHGFVRGGRWTWRATRAWLQVLRVAHLGRRPVLGPALPLGPPPAPYAVLPTDPDRALPAGTRHALRWAPAEGGRARLLRCVPPAGVGLAALSAYAGVRLLTRPRMAARPSGRVTA